MRLIAMILIVGGVLALLLGGFSYTKNDKKADLGPIEVHVKDKEHVDLPPILGGVALGLGIVLLAMTTRRGRLAA